MVSPKEVLSLGDMVDGAAGDVNVDHPITPILLMETMVSPKEALSHGVMVDGAAGGVNVDQLMTKNLLKLKVDFLKEVQSHGDMVDGADEVDMEVVVAGDGENNLPSS